MIERVYLLSSRSSRRFEVEVGGGDARVFFDRDRGVVERGGDGANDALLERRRQQKNRTPPGRNRRRGFDDHGENGIDDFWPEDLKQLRTPIMAGNWKCNPRTMEAKTVRLFRGLGCDGRQNTG